MTQEQMIRYLLFQHILSNPLPWRVGGDWSFEVIATNQHIVAKCKSPEEAGEIIKMAEKLCEEIEVIVVKAEAE